MQLKRGLGNDNPIFVLCTAIAKYTLLNFIFQFKWITCGFRLWKSLHLILQTAQLPQNIFLYARMRRNWLVVVANSNDRLMCCRRLMRILFRRALLLAMFPLLILIETKREVDLLQVLYHFKLHRSMLWTCG